MKTVAILSVLLVLLVACAPAEKETVETSEPVKEEFKVGFIGPLTGDVASIGVPVRQAAELALEEVNNNNLLDGRKMTMLFEDDQCDPKKTTTIAQKFVEVDKVTAVAGPFCSGTVLASAPIFEPANVLVLAPGATNPKIKDSGDYIFRVVPPDTNQGAEGAKFVKKLGAKKVGVLSINNDWGVGLKDAFKAEAIKQGLTLTEEVFDPGATDMRTQVTKVKLATPDVIYLIAHPKETELVLKALAEAGVKVPIVGADGSKDDVVLSAGAAAEGFIVTAPGVPKSPELEKFAAAFKAKFGKEYGPYTPEMYDVVNLLAKACSNTDCTSTAMKEYLYNMGDYSGASGTYNFDAFGEVEKSYDFWQIKDGKWEAYFPG